MDLPAGTYVELPSTDVLGSYVPKSDAMIIVAGCLSGCRAGEPDFSFIDRIKHEVVILVYSAPQNELISFARQRSRPKLRFVSDPHNKLTRKLNAYFPFRWYIIEDSRLKSFQLDQNDERFSDIVKRMDKKDIASSIRSHVDGSNRGD